MGRSGCWDRTGVVDRGGGGPAGVRRTSFPQQGAGPTFDAWPLRSPPGQALALVRQRGWSRERPPATHSFPGDAVLGAAYAGLCTFTSYPSTTARRARCRAPPSAPAGSGRRRRRRAARRARARRGRRRRGRASSAPRASARRSRVRAPTSGTMSSPRASTQAIATCATVTPLPSAISRSASTRARLRSRFSLAKRGAWARKSPAASSRSAREVPADQPAAEHAVGGDGDPELAARRQDLVLDPARDERVLDLQVADRMRRRGAADRLRAHLGEADVPDVAGLDELGDRPDGLLDRHLRGPGAPGGRRRCARRPAGSACRPARS